MSLIDEISPIFVGARAIKLTLADPNVVINAFDIVQINIDYEATEPEGVTLPLELLVVAPSPANFKRTMFRRVRPSEFFFKPVEGGPHSVAFREVGHNNWVGAIVVQVQGDTTSTDNV